MIQHAVRYPLTSVADLYDDSIEVVPDLQLGFPGSRMQVDVCETGLHDAEDRKFGFFRQPWQFLKYFHFDMQTIALVNSAHVAMDCGVQSTLIKHGRVKQVGKGPQFI